MTRNHSTAMYAGILGILAFPPTLVAQEDVLEEVVVTATKRSLSLRDIAGAASVIGGERIRPGVVQEVRDMLVDVPSLSIGDQFGFARVFMRGIGMTSIDIGGEGAVAFLQDGAIVPRPAAQLMGMFDLKQVEVLRGPQGTLYGRGATAGAINMVTSRPGDEFGGYANFTLGNYETVIFQGAIDVPLNDEFAVRAAVKWDERAGYGENKFSGEEVDDRDAQFFRLTMQWDPLGPFDATLSAQYYEEDDNNYAFHYFGPSEGTIGGLPLAVPVLGGQTVFDVKGDFYDINSDQEAINERNGYLVNLLMNYEIDDSWELRSITSVQNFDRFLRDDLDSTDKNLYGQNNYDEESDSFSQEFILNYSTERFDVLGGVMYFEEDLYGNVLVPQTNICFVLAPDLCGTPIGDALNSGKYLQDGDVEIEAWGAYAEATYHFSERLSLIAGLRYNFEERDGTGSFVFDGAGININTDSSEDWDDWTPRVTVQFNLNEYIMLYGTYTEAFKSGVINTGSLSPPLDPETVDAWEFGIKGAAGSSSINYSLAVFHYDYEDLQISFVDETSVVSTINAAEAENYGVELELDAELGHGFSLDFYATYLSAEYEEFFNGDYANGFALTDLSGNTLPNAPENTLKLGINYENEFGGVAIRARGEVYYQDEVYFTEWNRSDAYQDSYELYNASIDVLFADSAWMLTLWGRNLGDEEVYSNNIITAPLYNSLRVGSTLPPRTYGATVGFEF